MIQIDELSHCAKEITSKSRSHEVRSEKLEKVNSSLVDRMVSLSRDVRNAKSELTKSLKSVSSIKKETDEIKQINSELVNKYADLERQYNSIIGNDNKTYQRKVKRREKNLAKLDELCNNERRELFKLRFVCMIIGSYSCRFHPSIYNYSQQ